MKKLTKKEIEILKYIASGFSDIGISKIMFLSVNTIKTHIAHIYKKLDLYDNPNYNKRVLLVYYVYKKKGKKNG